MEGNEIEIAASLYACKKGKELRMNDEGASDRDEYIFIGTSALAFKAGANWQKERENAEIERLKAALKSEVEVNRVFRMCNEKDKSELTRTNAQLDEMVTKYNELSKKYADLYSKYYGK